MSLGAVLRRRTNQSKNLSPFEAFARCTLSYFSLRVESIGIWSLNSGKVLAAEFGATAHCKKLSMVVCVPVIPSAAEGEI